MGNEMDSGKRGYRFASIIYDPVVERMNRRIRKHTLEIIGLKSGDKIVDVCCGTGRQAEIFAETGAEVCGVELSDFMLEKTKKREKQNLSFVQANAKDTGLAESYFDYATTGFSLHEVDAETRNGFLNEMSRITRPDGFLIFTDFSIQTKNGFKNIFFKKVSDSFEFFAGGEHYRHYVDWMKNGGLTEYLSSKGYTATSSISLNGGHILIVKVANKK